MDAKDLFEQAREAHSTGDFERAAQLYERVISDYHVKPGQTRGLSASY